MKKQSKNYKRKKPEFIVYFDTNIIYSNDDGEMVSSSLFKKIDEIRGEIDLKLFVPSIVKEELIFQIFDKSYSNIGEIERRIDKISRIVNKKFSHNAKSKIIKACIVSNVNEAFKKNDLAIKKAPIKKLDWKKAINDAIWREPPFERVKKNNYDLEKGFKDYIIMHTVINDFLKQKKSINVVFLTNDKKLIEGIDKNIGRRENFSVYSEVDEFITLVKLKINEFDNVFIKKILPKASKKFFDENNDKSLYFKHSIQSEILNKFNKEFKVESYKTGTLLTGLDPYESSEWKKIGKSTFYIHPPKYISSNDNIFEWESRVDYIANYGKDGDTQDRDNYSILNLFGSKKSLILNVAVCWESFVKNDTRFYKNRIKNIKLLNNKFEYPSQEEIKRYNIFPEKSSQEES